MEKLTFEKVQELAAKGKIAKVTIKFKEEEVEYLLMLPSGKKARNLTAGAVAVVTPFLAKLAENNEDYNMASEAFKQMIEDEEAPLVDAPKFDFFTLAMSLSKQITEKEFEDVADGLLEGLYDSKGNPVDLDEEFFGERMVIYWKLLRWAAQEILIIPLVSMLGEEGSSTISTFLQQLEDSPMGSILSGS